jgi:autotransporter-associated beta strand protein
LTLSGTNTYSGGTTLDSGTLLIDSALSLPSETALTVNGGILNLGGYTTNPLSTVTLNDGIIQNGTLRARTSFDLYKGEISANLSALESYTELNKYGSDVVSLTASGGVSMPTTIVWNGALLIYGTLSGDTLYVGGDLQQTTPPGTTPYTYGTLVVPDYYVNHFYNYTPP